MNQETIIVGVAVGVLELLFKPIQKTITVAFKKWMESNARRSQSEVYEKKAAIDALLTLIETNEEVVRAMIIQTRDSGGIPKPNTPIFGTIVSPQRYSHTFRNQLLDAYYCDVLSVLISQKRAELTTSEMPDGAILKDLFIVEDITSAIFFDAEITKTDYNFIAVCLNVPITEIKSETRDDIRQRVSDILRLTKN